MTDDITGNVCNQFNTVLQM